MLYTPGSEFTWQVDNFGSTYSDAGFGANSPGHANANTKGANTQMLAGIAEDCYGITIGFSGGNSSGTIRRQMVDLIIDPAAGVGGAGSSWTVAINNLYANSPYFGNLSGYWYYFPLYLKAGTAIGTAHQDLASGTQALRVGIRVYGKPTHPELVRVGTKVATIGATVATTTGVAITPGTSAAWGSYTASMGTLPHDAWWWQMGIGSADTSMSTQGYLFDLAINATNKRPCIQEMAYCVGATIEIAAKEAFGHNLPICHGTAGEDVYARGMSINASTDTGMTVVAYALGG